MAKKRGLGKSLDALLSYATHATTITTEEKEPSQSEKLCHLALEQIHTGKYQPRRDIDPDTLEELANSIRVQGIIQPIVVRPVNEGYEIIAGERRWRAAKLAGLTEIPALIRMLPDEAAMAIGLIENIQRENLNPVEEAFALQRLIEEFEMTHQQVAEAIGKSRTTVTNLLRLLNLPEKIKLLLASGELEMGHARALLTLTEELQLQAAQKIIEKKLSVRDTEALVQRLQSPKTITTSRPVDPDVQRLQQDLSHHLKLAVAIRHNARGRGKVVIRYRSLLELEKLLAYLYPSRQEQNDE